MQFEILFNLKKDQYIYLIIPIIHTFGITIYNHLSFFHSQRRVCAGILEEVNQGPPTHSNIPVSFEGFLDFRERAGVPRDISRYSAVASRCIALLVYFQSPVQIYLLPTYSGRVIKSAAKVPRIRWPGFETDLTRPTDDTRGWGCILNVFRIHGQEAERWPARTSFRFLADPSCSPPREKRSSAAAWAANGSFLLLFMNNAPVTLCRGENVHPEVELRSWPLRGVSQWIGWSPDRVEYLLRWRWVGLDRGWVMVGSFGSFGSFGERVH